MVYMKYGIQVDFAESKARAQKTTQTGFEFAADRLVAGRMGKVVKLGTCMVLSWVVVVFCWRELFPEGVVGVGRDLGLQI